MALDLSQTENLIEVDGTRQFIFGTTPLNNTTRVGKSIT
jgi:hypothetical protein